MILDATAGNRSMWTHKNSKNIIYIDIEKQLWNKPTIYADCTQTPFKDKTFNAIFFDPPHDWGAEPFDFEMGKFLKSRQWGKTYPFQFTYYGWDKYKTKQELIVFIYKAQKEFYRILKDDGLLLVKWCEVKIPKNRFLAIFENWRLLMELPIGDPTHTWGEYQTYWFIMEKKEQPTADLLSYQ